MNRPKVLITRADLPKKSIDKIKAECDVDMYEKNTVMPKEDFLRRVAGKNGLFCCFTEEINKEVLDIAGDQLKVVATMSVGYDHIDLNACKEKNVLVSNTPNVNADSVAEWTVMLMISAGRRFLEAATATRRGEWTQPWCPTWLCGRGLKDSVIGIVGMGRIGQRVMKRVLPFGVKQVLYFDIIRPIKPAEEMGAVFVEFEELIRNSDFVACMVNLTDDTRNLFNKKVFDLMKPTAVFINTSRGATVNQEDLYNILKNKKIRAAAIDVTIPEPLSQKHKLTTLSNLVLTPHVAASETNVINEMANLVAENILLGVKGKPLKTPVPFPE